MVKKSNDWCYCITMKFFDISDHLSYEFLPSNPHEMKMQIAQTLKLNLHLLYQHMRNFRCKINQKWTLIG